MATLKEIREKYKSQYYNGSDNNVASDTSLKSIREKYKSARNDNKYEYDTDEVNYWFTTANQVVNGITKTSKNPNYDFAKNQTKIYSNYIKQLNDDSDYIKEYINSLKGTKQYDTLKKQFKQYKRNINNISTYTNNLSEFASQFDNEKDYDTAVRQVKYIDKYKDLNTYDDLRKAIKNVNEGDYKGEEIAWIKNKAYEVATYDELQQRYDDIDKKRVELINTPPKEISKYKEHEERQNALDAEQNKIRSYMNNKKLDEYYFDLPKDIFEKVQKYVDFKNREVVPTADGSYVYDIANYMSPEEEKQIYDDFNSLAKQGYDLEELEKWFVRGREKKKGDKETENIQKDANEHPVEYSIGSVVLQPLMAMGSAVQKGKAFVDKLNGGDGYVNVSSDEQYQLTKGREAISNGIGNDFGSFLYNTGMSMADFAMLLPLNAVPGGQALSLSIMGTEAGTNAANEVLESGGNINNAIATGVASGVAEAFFEKFSIEQLKVFKQSGSSSCSDVVKNVLKGAFTEGSEEAFTDMANLVTDNIINGDMSQFSQAYNNYIAQGYSEEEANRMAWQDWGIQLAQSFAGGALSGGIMNAGVGGLNYTQNYKTGKSIKANNNASELIRIGKSFDVNTNAYKEAEKLEQKQSKKGKVSSAEIGQLRNTILQEENNTIALEKKLNVEKYVNSSNLSSSEKTIAKKFLQGESLTQNDVDTLNNSKKLQSVVQNLPEMDNATIKNFAKAYLSTGMELPKLEVQDFKKIDTTDMSTNEALNEYAVAQNMNQQTRQSFIENYDGKMNVDEYALEFLHFNNLGKLIQDYNQIDHSKFSLNNEAKMSAYEQGLKTAKAHMQISNKLTEAQKQWQEENNGYTKGNVDTSSIDYSKLNAEQKNSIKYASQYAKFGLNIKFVQTEADRNGVYTDPNGSYNPATNTITIDVNSTKAKVQDEIKRGAILYTLSHELTHVSENATEEYIELRKAVQQVIGNQDWNGLIEKHTETLRKTQPDKYNSMTELERSEYASQEALAEACSNMLKESDILLKMANDNPTVTKKLINFFKNVIEKIRKLLAKNSEVNAQEAHLLEEAADDLQSIVDKWEKAVIAGIKNQNAKMQSNEQKNNTADNSDVKNSFAGREAKIANMSLLEQAVQMENNSEDTETIRKKTGWFRGYDGKWRFEIDDSKMEINESDKEYLKKSGSTLLGYFIAHEKLFEAYPELKDMMIYTKYFNSVGDAYYSHKSKSITIDTKSLNSLSDNEFKKLLIHEIQHAIQDIEDFTSGADTSDFFTYLKTAGEIEAYDTGDRINMTAEQRKNTKPDIDRLDVVFSEDSNVDYYIEFSPIDEENRQNAISRGDIVINNKDGLFNAIEESLQHKSLKNNYIISALPKEVKDKIISDTNSIVFKKGSYVVKISSDDIRHINAHFHNKNDIVRAIYRLYDVICNYDIVSVLKIGQQNRLKFEKSYADFDYLSIEIASKKKRCLDLVTFYITKNNKKKKGKMQSPAKYNNLAHQGVSPSNTNIPQNGTSVNNNSMQKSKNNSGFNETNTEKYQSRTSDLDNKYFNAVENNDLETAQKLVDEVAKKTGYDSPVLYHGTLSFGFTEFDLNKMDDGRSIFLTSSKEIASTYSGIEGVTKISERNDIDVDKLSVNQTVELLNKHAQEPTIDFSYSYMNNADINNLISKVNSGIDYLKDEVNKEIEKFRNDAETLDKLNDLKYSLNKYQYDKLSTKIYMLFHHGDTFRNSAEQSNKINQIEQDIRLMNALLKSEKTECIVEKALGGYSIELLTFDEAKEKLRQCINKGNYSLYAKLGKSFVINSDGKNWNDIQFEVSDNKYEIQQSKYFDGKYEIINKSILQPEYVGGKRIFNSYEEAENALNTLDDRNDWKKRLNTTRDIAEYAKSQGYDSVIFKNIRDNGGNNVKVRSDTVADIFVIFNPNDVKSADPVTYDDNGNVIPLSERFNSEKTDIRYQERGNAMSDSDLLENAEMKVNEAPDFSDFSFDDDFEDLFETEEKKIEFEKMVADSPELALQLVYKSSANTAKQVLNNSKDTKLSDIAYKRIANKVIKDYFIEPTQKTTIIENLRKLTENSTEDNFSEQFEKFVLECRDSLFYSNMADDEHEQRRKDIKSYLKGKTLLIPENEVAGIASHYESIKHYRNLLFFRQGLNVALEKNAKQDISGQKNGVSIETLIGDLQLEGELTGIDRTDGGDAYIALEEYLNKTLAPKYSNPFLDGQLENIEVASVEMAFDVMSEYTREVARQSTHGNNSKLVRKLRDTLKKTEAQRDGLLKAKKENYKTYNQLQRYKSISENLKDDTKSLAEVNRQIQDIISTEGADKSQLDNLNLQKTNLEKQITKNRNSLIRQVPGLQTVLKAEKKKAVQKTQEKYSEKLRQSRQTRDEKLKQLRAEKNEYISKLRKEKNQRIEEERQKGIEKVKDVRKAKKISDYVAKIKRLQGKMTKRLVNPTDNAFVPKELINAYSNVCSVITDAINMKNGTKTSMALLELSATIKQLNEGSMNGANEDYVGEYSEIIKSIDDMSIYLKQVIGDKTIRRKELTLQEAEDIYNILKEVYGITVTATKQLLRDDKTTNYESGEAIRVDNEKLVNYKKSDFAAYVKTNVLNGIRTARYLTGYNDNSELMYHVNALNEGNRKTNYWAMNSEKLFTDYTEAHEKEYKSSTHDIVDIDGVKLTRMMGLQILMSWEREVKGQNLVHMRTGGITIPDAELLVKGRVAKAFDKTSIVKITPSFIVKVENSMTEFENGYRKIAEQYFNERAKQAINEVSNVLKHRDIATSDYYIPFAVDQNFVIKELDNLKYDSTLEGMGMLKSTVIKAKQPIIISGLDNVIKKHINDTSKLYGLAIPCRNFKKALNVKFDEGDSVRNSIQSIWGKKGNDFFDGLISDMESPRDADKQNPSKLINNGIKLFRKALVLKTLTANISVVIKQAASYPTAGAYLSGSSLSKAFVTKGIFRFGISKNGYAKTIAEIDKYTAQHYVRRQGLSTQEIAEMSNSKLNKLPTAINPTKWIQGVDCLTTAMLWEATKNDVNSKYRKNGKDIDTEEYWKDVTNLYDKVIEDTQPMYDVLHRTELQKNTSDLWRTVFIFKTQPLQNTGIIYDSIGYAMQNKNSAEAKKNVVKAFTSQMTSLATFALMSFVAAAFLHKRDRYKDENDEVTFQSIISTILVDMMKNGIGVAIPLFGTEFADFIQNKGKYDAIRNLVVDTINDTAISLADASISITTELGNVINGYRDFNGENFFTSLYKAGEQISGLFGVPTQNVINIIKGLYEHGNDIINGEFVSGYTQSQGDRSNKEYALSYGDFYNKGDYEKANSQLKTLYDEKYEYYKAEGYSITESKKEARGVVRDALSNAYKEEYQKAFIRNDTGKMQEISSILQRSGYMTWVDKTLSQVLSQWRINAKDDLAK